MVLTALPKLVVHLEKNSVYLARDKGNRKDTGHSVKILCWWDPNNNWFQTQILDIDGSNGSTKECGNIVEYSMKKLSWVLC